MCGEARGLGRTILYVMMPEASDPSSARSPDKDTCRSKSVEAVQREETSESFGTKRLGQTIGGLFFSGAEFERDKSIVNSLSSVIISDIDVFGPFRSNLGLGHSVGSLVVNVYSERREVTVDIARKKKKKKGGERTGRRTKANGEILQEEAFVMSG